MITRSSTVSDRLARRQSAQDRMLRLSLRSIREQMAAARRAAIAAFAAAHHLIDMQAVADIGNRLRPLLIDAAVATHLRARYDVSVEASGVKRRLSTFDDTMAFLRKRMQLTAKQTADLEETYGPYSARVATDFGTLVNRRLADEMAQSVAANETVALGIDRLERTFDDLGIGDQPSHVLESIFRTQTQLAYSAGESNAYQDPDIDQLIWGYEYLTVGDERVRPEHSVLEGVRLEKGDPKWDSIWPPNGFNCRCTTIPIYVDDEKALRSVKEPKPKTIDGVVRTGKPDEGWDFNPGQVFRDTLLTSQTKGASLAMSLLIEHGEMSNIELAQLMDCTPQSSFAVLGRLVDRGQVDDLGMVANRRIYRISRRGRRTIDQRNAEKAAR